MNEYSCPSHSHSPSKIYSLMEEPTRVMGFESEISLWRRHFGRENTIRNSDGDVWTGGDWLICDGRVWHCLKQQTTDSSLSSSPWDQVLKTGRWQSTKLQKKKKEQGLKKKPTMPAKNLKKYKIKLLYSKLLSNAKVRSSVKINSEIQCRHWPRCVVVKRVLVDGEEKEVLGMDLDAATKVNLAACSCTCIDKCRNATIVDLNIGTTY